MFAFSAICCECDTGYFLIISFNICVIGARTECIQNLFTNSVYYFISEPFVKNSFLNKLFYFIHTYFQNTLIFL